MRNSLVVAMFALAVTPSNAEPAAEKLTAKKCEDIGISVAVTYTAGARLHEVTVKIPKDQEWFKAGAQIPRIVEGGSGTPVRISIPVGVTTDSRRNRVINFSMTREMLTETRLWVRENRYIELKPFLQQSEAR